jgi:hypothetical protein
MLRRKKRAVGRSLVVAAPLVMSLSMKSFPPEQGGRHEEHEDRHVHCARSSGCVRHRDEEECQRERDDEAHGEGEGRERMTTPIRWQARW